MAKKAFLYTGATFLLMTALLISANYLLLSKHTASESKMANLEIDSVNNLVSDARSMLFTNPNNVLADAMSDAMFFGMNVSGERNPNVIFQMIDPTNKKSEDYHTNITKWFLNYTNITLSYIEKNYPIKVNISEPAIVKVDASGYAYGHPPVGAQIKYIVNISYSIALNASTYINITQNLNRTKWLDISGPTSNGFGTIYHIIVYDQSQTDFEKYINCNNVYCVTCANPTCT